MNEAQYKPELGEKRDRKYKGKYLLAEGRYMLTKKIAILLFVLLTGTAFLLGLALKGNLALAKRLEGQTITIMPSGEVVQGVK